MSTPCPKADHHTEHEHIDLGNGAWRHLKKKLTHAEAQQIEVAGIAANYETAGASQLTQALIKSVLYETPLEWQQEHLDSTLAVIDRFLDQYETDHELALKKPETRQAMAQATIDLYDTRARIFCADGSIDETWPLADGQHCRIVEQRALRAWNRWNTEMRDRLKDDGADAD